MWILGRTRVGAGQGQLVVGSRTEAAVIALLITVAVLTLAVVTVGIVINARSTAIRADADRKTPQGLPHGTQCQIQQLYAALGDLELAGQALARTSTGQRNAVHVDSLRRLRQAQTLLHHRVRGLERPRRTERRALVPDFGVSQLTEMREQSGAVRRAAQALAEARESNRAPATRRLLVIDLDVTLEILETLIQAQPGERIRR